MYWITLILNFSMYLLLQSNSFKKDKPKLDISDAIGLCRHETCSVHVHVRVLNAFNTHTVSLLAL